MRKIELPGLIPRGLRNMGQLVRSAGRNRFMLWAAVAVLAAVAAASAQPGALDDSPTNSAPNPYKTIENWAKLPEGWTWGATASVSLDRAGHIWVLQRCGGNTCLGATEDPILEFDTSGKLLKSFGTGLFVNPHGFAVDKEGNVWVTDFQAKDNKGMQVFKISSEGKVLMTLGKAGIAGDGPDTFNQPSAVAIAPNGSIFVADGHGANGNERIVKFSGDGKFIKAWGKKGTGPGEFGGLHALAFDTKGRLFVADRDLSRIEIFDQEGTFIAEWKQFGRPSGIYIRNDIIYVADSQSNEKVNAPFKQGIRIGSVKDGKVTAFIPQSDPKAEMPEAVTADKDGNIFGGFTADMDVKEFVKN